MNQYSNRWNEMENDSRLLRLSFVPLYFLGVPMRNGGTTSLSDREDA
jgi:hypothetical protein